MHRCFHLCFIALLEWFRTSLTKASDWDCAFKLNDDESMANSTASVSKLKLHSSWSCVDCCWWLVRRTNAVGCVSTLDIACNGHGVLCSRSVNVHSVATTGLSFEWSSSRWLKQVTGTDDSFTVLSGSFDNRCKARSRSSFPVIKVCFLIICCTVDSIFPRACVCDCTMESGATEDESCASNCSASRLGSNSVACALTYAVFCSEVTAVTASQSAS